MVGCLLGKTSPLLKNILKKKLTGCVFLRLIHVYESGANIFNFTQGVRLVVFIETGAYKRQNRQKRTENENFK